MGKDQYFIPSESNFYSIPRSDAASSWTPTARQSSSSNEPSNPQCCGTPKEGLRKHCVSLKQGRNSEHRPMDKTRDLLVNEFFFYVKYTLSVIIYEDYRLLRLFDKVKTRFS